MSTTSITFQPGTSVLRYQDHHDKSPRTGTVARITKTTVVLTSGERYTADGREWGNSGAWFHRYIKALPAAPTQIEDTAPVSPQIPPDASGQEPRSIVYNDITHRYRAYWDETIVGDFWTQHDADRALDTHTLSLLEDGLIDTVPRSIYAGPAEIVPDEAPERRVVILARPAEPATPDERPVAPIAPSAVGEAAPASDEGQAELSLPESIALALTGMIDPRCELCGTPAFVSHGGHLYCKKQWQKGYCVGPIEPLATNAARGIAWPELTPEELAAIGCLPPAPATPTVAPDAAYLAALDGTAPWPDMPAQEDQRHAANRSTLESLIAAVLTQRIILASPTPYDDALRALTRCVARERMDRGSTDQAIADEFSDAPEQFLADFDAMAPAQQGRATRRLSRAWGCGVEEVDVRLVDARERIAALRTLGLIEIAAGSR